MASLKDRVEKLEADLRENPMRHYVYSDLPFIQDVVIQELKSELHTHIEIGNQQFTITEYTVKGDADNV